MTTKAKSKKPEAPRDEHPVQQGPIEIIQIQLDQVADSPFQVRAISGTAELDAALMDLAANIKQHGLINPITVRPLAAGGVECVAGHRRLAAARLAGPETISATVLTIPDSTAEEILVSENLYRQDLTAIEESATVISLLKTREVDDVAKLCHKSDRWVYRRMLLDKLSTTAKTVSRLYKWSASFCEVLAEHDHNQQDALILSAVKDLGAEFRDVLDGKADISASNFFAGSMAALSDAENKVAPRPVKAKRKKSSVANKPSVDPLPVPQDEAPSVVSDPDIKRVTELVEEMNNPLTMLDKTHLVLLLTSPDWDNPFDCDYECAIEVLWTRLKASIGRRIIGTDAEASKVFATAVEKTLNEITGQKATTTEGE